MARMGRLMLLLLRGIASSSVSAAEESDESSCLAVRKKTTAVEPSSGIGYGQLDASAYEATVDSVIEEAFRNVTGLGSDILPMQPDDPVWQKCAEYDLSSDTARGAKMVAGVGRLLGCEDRYKYDNTCKAINASFDAVNALQDKFPEGPKFANYFVNNWAGIPSWANWTMGPGGVNQSVMPPSADVAEPNGIMLYALCDILRTILTQAPNQYLTGSCGWMATLGVLSYEAPAKAIRMGIRLLWTGRVVPQISLPCDPITETQFPGLIPFQNKDGSWNPPDAADYPYAQESNACSGNSVDCKKGHGKPSSPAGLTGSWTQSLISAWRQSVDIKCGDGEGELPLQYPGASEALIAQNTDVNGMSVGEAMWACNSIIDPQNTSCKYLFNPATCGTQDLQACGDYRLQVRAGPHTPPDDQYPQLQYFAAEMMQFTEELLQKACSAEVAILNIDSNPLEDRLLAGGQRQNHWVYLRSCDPAADVYTIWSWGELFNATKADLLGEPLDDTSLLSLYNTSFVSMSLDPGETAASIWMGSWNPYAINTSAFNTGWIAAAVVADGITSAPSS